MYAAVHNESALQEALKTTEKDSFKKGDKAFPHLFLFLPTAQWKGRDPGYV